MTTKRIKTIASICLISGLSFTKANAAIIVVAPTAASAGSIQITQDISFTINTESTILAFGFVFDEWVTSDGSQTISALPNYLSNNLKLKINGGTTLSYSVVDYYDNYDSNFGTAVTANDGLIFVGSDPVLAVDDVVTLLASTYTISSGAVDSNPLATQTFTGNMFIANQTGTQISDVVVVPEPKTFALLLGLVAMPLVIMRRRAH